MSDAPSHAVFHEGLSAAADDPYGTLRDALDAVATAVEAQADTQDRNGDNLSAIMLDGLARNLRAISAGDAPIIPTHPAAALGPSGTVENGSTPHPGEP